MRSLLLAALALLVASTAWSQTIPTHNVVPTCTFATVALCGGISGNNALVRISDSDTVEVGATIGGGGGNEVLAYCEGTTCYVAGDDAPISGSSALTGTTSATFTVNSDSAGGETTTITTGGADPMVIGASNKTQVTVVTDGGTVTMDGVVSVPGDITAAKSSATANFGENQAANNEFTGLPRVALAVVGAMGNGPVLSEPITPAAASCAPIVAGSEADDATLYRTGSTSYQYTFQATVGAGEGLDCDITGPAVTAMVSYGFWFRSDTTFSAGTLEIVLDDGAAAEATEDMPAYATADEWVWIEVDVTADCAATCADIDGVFIQTTASAPTEMNAAIINVDSGAIWIAGCEETLGADVLVDGVLSIVGQPTAAGAEVLLAEWTDYFVHYQTGNDAVCMITDQSANSGVVLYAY